MDDVSHILWSYLFLYWTGHPWLAIIFGVLPDLLCFTPAFIYQIIWRPKGKDFVERYKKFPGWMKTWAEQGYNVTHNLFTTAVITAIALFTGAWWLLAWTLHVLMDIPTHSKGFYATPLFWPLWDFKIDGIPWSDKRIMIPNAIALGAGYAYLLLVVM